MFWSQRTWAELPGDLAAVHAAAMLPVGATEQHGPHLGCGVDAVLAEQLCSAVAVRTGVPMLPTLPYGCSLGHSRRWPGTIAVQPTTLIELVAQIGEWAYHGGVRRLFIVNTHVTNAAPLRCALEVLRARHDELMVAVFDSAALSERVRAFHIADGADWHANCAETSLMLAVAPQLARPELLGHADDPDRTTGLVFAHPVNRTSTNGVTGRPSAASAELGRRAFGWMVEDLCELVRRGLEESPPLEHSYFSPTAADARTVAAATPPTERCPESSATESTAKHA
jgi:creatinine amidohydrolase